MQKDAFSYDLTALPFLPAQQLPGGKGGNWFRVMFNTTFNDAYSFNVEDEGFIVELSTVFVKAVACVVAVAVCCGDCYSSSVAE